jgi:hypothetical protein
MIADWVADQSVGTVLPTWVSLEIFAPTDSDVLPETLTDETVTYAGTLILPLQLASLPTPTPAQARGGPQSVQPPSDLPPTTPPVRKPPVILLPPRVVEPPVIRLEPPIIAPPPSNPPIIVTPPTNPPILPPPYIPTPPPGLIVPEGPIVVLPPITPLPPPGTNPWQVFPDPVTPSVPPPLDGGIFPPIVYPPTGPIVPSNPFIRFPNFVEQYPVPNLQVPPPGAPPGGTWTWNASIGRYEYIWP